MSRSNTKQQILSVAAKLFSKRGYYGVSMQDIADQLSLTKAALYYHFPSKDQLIRELLRGSLDELKTQLKAASKHSHLPADKLFNVVKTFLDFKISHPELLLLSSLGSISDDSDPVLQFIQDLRLELTKFIRELIGGIDFVRKFTFGSLQFITTSLLSLVFSPFQNTISSRIAKDFTDVWLSNTVKEV